MTARGSCHVGSVAYLLARLAAACGDDDTAARLFDEAAKRDERAGATAFAQRDRRARDELAHAGYVLRRRATTQARCGRKT